MNEHLPHQLDWTDDQVERFWAYWGDKSEFYFAESYGPAILRRTRRFVTSGAVCVDYGCGTGGLIAALLAAGHTTGAVDFSPKAVAQVAGRFAGRTGFLGARRIGEIADASFPPADVVFSIEAIEHVTDPHVENYFASIRGLLKPEGIAIFTTPNDEDIAAASVYCPESGAIFHPMQHVRSFDPARIRAFLGAHGFATIETFVTDFALSFAERPKAWIADKGKRLLRMGAPPPHLVAIARKVS